MELYPGKPANLGDYGVGSAGYLAQVLTVKGMGERIKWHHKVLIIFTVLVNMKGVIGVNKFGWWA